MKRRGLYIFLVLAMLGYSSHSQPFICDNSLYLTRIPNGASNSALIKAYRDSIANSWKFEEMVTDLGYVVKPIGYRVQDNYIYGITQPDLTLIRIDSNGEVEELVSLVERGLDTAEYHFFAGDVVPGGHTFFLVGQDKETGIAESIFNIQLRGSNYRIGRMAFVSFTDMQIDDIAYDPIYGSIRSFDRKSKQTIIMGQGGTANNYFSVSLPTVGQLSAVFLDKSGLLIGMGNRAGDDSPDNFLYEFNKFTGELLSRVEIPKGEFTAGCSCPYSIDFFKEVSPDTSAGCEPIRVRYEFVNKMGTGQGNIVLRDTLDEQLVLKEIIHQPFLSTVNYHEDTRIIEIMMREIVLGRDSLIVELTTQTKDFSSWETQASLGPFPVGVGQTQLSDNPLTEIKDDASRLSGSPLMLSLPESVYICEDSAILLPTIQPANATLDYFWNTGDSLPFIAAKQAGWYSLTVKNDCQVLTDSTLVQRSSVPLSVDLGPDQSVEEGQQATLSFNTNIPGPYTLLWEADSSLVFDCTDCEQLIGTWINSTAVSLTLTDVNGCLVSDTIVINVEKPRELQIANVFTPNGDGINDIFYLQGRTIATFRTFRLVDRWGNTVFERKEGQVNNPQHGWKGNRNGEPAGSGVYYYVADIVFPDGDVKQVSGYVTLIR